MKVEKTCPECGKVFLDWPRGRSKYCSKGCYRLPLYKRLLRNLIIAPNGCWLFAGFKSPEGYGRICVTQTKGKGWKYELVSRVSYQHFKGPIEPNMLICHHCDTPACFRPSHLYQGTHSDNAADKVKRGRMNPPVGERAGSAKLTSAQVLSIRRDYATGVPSLKDLATTFAVNKGTIASIVRRKTWAHV